MNRRTVVIGVVLGLVAILLMIAIAVVQSPITAHSYTVDLSNCIKIIDNTDIYRVIYDCSAAHLD